MSANRDSDDFDDDFPAVPPEPPAPPFVAATAPPGYTIAGELGRGGMGVVYDAVQTSLNRPCALKMVLGSGHAGSVALVRFLAEAEAVAAIDHPHVVRVFEFGNHAGQPFLAMERLDGGSLSDRLRATGPLPVGAAVTLLELVAAGVQAGHDLGIVHRDLKPANILLASDGTPKVADFGLAKRDGGGDLTDTQAMMGSPDYMSPEQAQGRAKFVGPTADVYSLGAILFAAVAGRPPFVADNLLDLRLKVIGEEAPSLSKFAPGLPRDVATVVAKCLAKAPGERYLSAAAFAEDLRRWRHGEPIVARAAGGRERAWKSLKRNRGLAAAVGTVLLTLGAGLVGTSVAAVRALDEAGRADGEAAKAVAAAGEAKAEATRADAEATNARAAAERAERQLERAERLNYASQIDKVDRVLRAGDRGSAARFLRRTRWDYRGWEHDYLTTQFQAGHATLTGHADEVTGAAFSPDGATVVSASLDGTARIWDAATGRELRALVGHTDGVTRATYSPDGATVVTASRDGTARLWDAATGRAGKTLLGHADEVTSAAFSPDGATVVSASRDGSVKLWDAATGVEVRTLAGHAEAVTSAAFSPDGGRVASADRNGTVRIWEAATGRELRTLSGYAGDLSGASFRPDGALLVTASDDDAAKLWDPASGRELRAFVGHTDDVTGAAFSPDGATVVSASRDETVRLWDAATGRELRTLTGHAGGVTAAAFSPDGGRVVTASRDGTVRIWDATGRPPQARAGVAAWVTSAPQSIDGTRVVSSGDDRTVRLWNPSATRDQRTLTGHAGGVTCTAFSPDGATVVTASRDLTVRLWDAAAGRELRTLAGHTHAVTSAAFSPDGGRVVSASDDNTVKLWDPATGQELLSLDGDKSGRGFAFARFSVDGRGIAGGGRDKTLTVWDTTVHAYEDVLRARSDAPDSSFAVTADGRRIVAGWLAGDDTVWSLTTGQLLPGEPAPAGLRFVTRADLPGGKRVAFVEGGRVVVRDTAKYEAFRAEMARRLAEYARPKPEWHAQSFDEALAAGHDSAARFHLAHLRKLRGQDDLTVRWREAMLPTVAGRVDP